MCLGLGFGDCQFTAAKSPVALHLDTTLICPQNVFKIESIKFALAHSAASVYRQVRICMHNHYSIHA